MTLRIFSFRNQRLLLQLLLHYACKERHAKSGVGPVTDLSFSVVLSD